jgi:Fe-S cluster biogenesis protein NfuA
VLLWQVVALIKELIETKVRPSVQDDGGDIFYEDFNEETGTVTLHHAILKYAFLCLLSHI